MKNLPTIVIKPIPHKAQRYDTVGDYWLDMLGRAQIRVSKMPPDEEFLVAIHELIEWYLITRKGIKISDIDEFDLEHERKGESFFAEPGDDPDAPYHKEHVIAETVERLLASYLDVDWEKYDKKIKAL